MLFTNSVQATAAALVLATGALAATQTIQVGQGGLSYTPSNITAAIGDIVEFQFIGGNHSLTQSTFAAPCSPQGINSGFRVGDAATPPTFSILVNDTQPFWAYCAQGEHCQAGMVFSINADETSDQGFAAFQAAAATATSGALPSGSTSGNATTGGASSSASGSASASASASGSASARASASGSASARASGASASASSAAASSSAAAASARPSGGATKNVVAGASAFVGLLVASFQIVL